MARGSGCNKRSEGNEDMRGLMGVQQQSRSTVRINSSLLYKVKVDAAAAETGKRASWGD